MTTIDVPWTSADRLGFLEAFGSVSDNAARAGALHLELVETPVGPMIAGATDAGVHVLEFAERQKLDAQAATVRRLFGPLMVAAPHRHLETLKAELQRYFAGTLRQFSVPVMAPGSRFEERVWGELLKIPFGETRSYQDVAVALGNRAAVRAVGRANGMNRIAIVIPCHRVVNKSGALGGYAGGLWRKRQLLDLELTPR